MVQIPHEHCGPSQDFKSFLNVTKSTHSFKSVGIWFQREAPEYRKEFRPNYVVSTFGWVVLEESRKE